MPIMKFKQFTVEAEIAGEMRAVVWDGRSLEICDVVTMGQAAEIIGRLSAGGTIAFAQQELDKMVEASGAEDAANPAGVAAKQVVIVPLATPSGALTVTMATDGMAAVARLEEAKTIPPKASAPPAQQENLSAAASASAAPASPSDGLLEGDLSVFGRFTKLSEVVAEVRKRGHENYAAILAYCARLGALGDVCPPIDLLVQGGKLEERLKVHCAGKGVPGVPA
jgi:hypothetical protein